VLHVPYVVESSRQVRSLLIFAKVLRAPRALRGGKLLASA